MLGLRRFVVQDSDALQNADYALIKRGTSRLVWNPLASAQEQRSNGGRSSNNRDMIGLQHIHFLRTSIPWACKPLFDARIMLEDSAFREFVGALCKLGWSACRVALMSAPMSVRDPIVCGRWCVVFALPFSTAIERTVRTVVSHGTPSIHTFSLFSVTRAWRSASKECIIVFANSYMPQFRFFSFRLFRFYTQLLSFRNW